MTKRGNRTNAEIINDITQLGAPVPAGYTYNPRVEPFLVKGASDVEGRSAEGGSAVKVETPTESSQKATKSKSED